MDAVELTGPTGRRGTETRRLNSEIVDPDVLQISSAVPAIISSRYVKQEVRLPSQDPRQPLLLHVSLGTSWLGRRRGCGFQTRRLPAANAASVPGSGGVLPGAPPGAGARPFPKQL